LDVQHWVFWSFFKTARTAMLPGEAPQKKILQKKFKKIKIINKKSQRNQK
jgi:hypothetical protein